MYILLYSCRRFDRVGMTDVGCIARNITETMTSVETAFSLDDELDSPTEESEREVKAIADDLKLNLMQLSRRERVERCHRRRQRRQRHKPRT